MLQRMRLEPSRFALHFAVLVIVALWTFPTAGLLVSSLRDKNQIAASGWWTALTTTERSAQTRTKEARPGGAGRQVRHHRQPVRWQRNRKRHRHRLRNEQSPAGEFAAGTTAAYDDGRTLTVNADGAYTTHRR